MKPPEIKKAINSSENFTIDQKPNYLLHIDIVKVNNNSYRISASLKLRNGDKILFKGSRGMSMETIIQRVFG